MPIQRQKVWLILYTEPNLDRYQKNESGHSLFVSQWRDKHPQGVIQGNGFCPPPGKKKKVHLVFDLFLIELPIYEAGIQGID